MLRFEKQNESEKASFRMTYRLSIYKNAKFHNAYIIYVCNLYNKSRKHWLPGRSHAVVIIAITTEMGREWDSGREQRLEFYLQSFISFI